MKSRTSILMIVIALFATLALPVHLAAQPPYTVIDLGTLRGTYSEGDSINNKGWVVGGATLPGDTVLHAFLWRKGLMRDLGTLGGPNSTAVFPLNERGEITGFSDTSTPEPLGEDFCGFGTNLICLPFLWQHGVMTPLPTLGGNNGQAFEINNRGQVVGVTENTTPDPTCVFPQVLQFEPVLWERGEIRELPTFPGDPDGLALAINDQGQAVGQSGNCTTFGVHGLLWQNSTLTDLGNLGGTHNNGPQDINNQGQVVGYSDLPGDTTAHAFLWTRDSGMGDLGTLPGDFSSFAAAINSKGQVVGFSCQGFGEDCRAFLWQSGVMTDLNTLIPAGSPLFLLTAFSNNSRGEIVGQALQISTGEVHAYLATPIQGEGPSAGLTSAAPVETSRLNKVLPENLRKILEQRLGHRYHIPRFGAPSYITSTPGSAKTISPSGALTSNKSSKPTITSFSPTSGPVGTQVAINGTGLTQTSKVTFGGLAATTFTVNSDTQVTATVPTGAVTGKIAITTPGGVARSSGSFTVITGQCGQVGAQCGASILPPCCPGLTCVPASTRAFCERVSSASSSTTGLTTETRTSTSCEQANNNQSGRILNDTSLQ